MSKAARVLAAAIAGWSCTPGDRPGRDVRSRQGYRMSREPPWEKDRVPADDGQRTRLIGVWVISPNAAQTQRVSSSPPRGKTSWDTCWESWSRDSSSRSTAETS